LSLKDDVKGKHPNIIQSSSKLNLGNKINNTLEFVVINFPVVLGEQTIQHTNETKGEKNLKEIWMHSLISNDGLLQGELRVTARTQALTISPASAKYRNLACIFKFSVVKSLS
jgi:hypothetical protein